jgi:hypothetical protein
MLKPFSPNENGILCCLGDRSITGIALEEDEQRNLSYQM